MEERLRRKRDIRIGLGNSNSYELEVYLWRIGDTLLLGTCCEPYSILQTELRKRFPGETIVCMNLINGSLGYLPPAHLYGEDIYPVLQTPFAKGCLEQLIDHCHQLILESNV